MGPPGFPVLGPVQVKRPGHDRDAGRLGIETNWVGIVDNRELGPGPGWDRSRPTKVIGKGPARTGKPE